MSNQKKKDYRKFGLTNLSVDNWVSVVILSVVILFAGGLSYVTMPKEASPEVVVPIVMIGTPYFGNSEVDIENLITRPIEKEVKSVEGIKKITSTSIQDYSSILVEFETGVSIDDALQEVKDKVDLATPDLPKDLDSEPHVTDINFSEFPIVTLNLSGDFGQDELKKYAEYLQDEIETLSEISEVVISGALDREVKVDVDMTKMKAMQLTFDDIERAILMENITMSGGNIKSRNFERSIRIQGEFKNIEELASIIVKSENGKPIYLKNIADVRFAFEDPTSIARADTYPVVSLDVIKKSGSNILNAIDDLRVIVADAQGTVLPDELKVSYFNDQSTQIRDQVSNLQNSIISGVLLVVLVLLFFLGFRNALFVGIAIPLSMLMGVLILSFFGLTLNIVVLFSLILALGLLVDNAIVVVENIYRYLSEGYSLKESAKRGTGEVALPIIAATATTLAAFVPLAFWPGIMGGFMKYMPITLIAVLLSSLFVALVFNPVYTSLMMKIDVKDEAEESKKRKLKVVVGLSIAFVLLAAIGLVTGTVWLRNLMLVFAGFTLLNYFLLRPASFYFQDSLLPILEKAYNVFISFSLKKFVSLPIVVGSFVLLMGTLILYFGSNPKIVPFPESDPLFVNAFVEMPNGTDIETTNKLTKELELSTIKMLKAKGYMPAVEDVLTQIGENTGDPAQPGGDLSATPHKARLTVSFVKYQDRNGIDTKEVFKDFSALFEGITAANITVAQNQNGPPQGKPINIEITGDDLDKLLLLSSNMLKHIEGQNIAGIEKLQSDVSKDKPQLNVNIDRQSARRFGLSTMAIASTIRTAQYGKEASKYKLGEDEYPIMLRLASQYRDDINALASQQIVFRDPATGKIVQVPISSVVDWENVNTYSAVKRKDLKRVVTLYSNVDKGYNENEVVQEIQASLEDFDMPTGYSFVFTGQQEEIQEQMDFLSKALAIAGAMILLIIVAQFNSLTAPIIVMFAFLFSLIGVFGGYMLTGMDFSVVMSMVGIISLAGVVVNNAIVLMDYIELLKRELREKLGLTDNVRLSDGQIKASIVKAGQTRLRPVLLTAITTVLGLVPLAIGLNIDFFSWVAEGDPKFYIGGDNVAFWGPLAWTVIYGMVFATFLTLVVVPVMYWLFYRLTNFILSIFGVLKPVATQE